MHSQTAAVNSRRGDERRGADMRRTEACKGLPASKSNVPLGRRTMGGGADVPHSPAT
jgi:hypothetical protein